MRLHAIWMPPPSAVKWCLSIAIVAVILWTCLSWRSKYINQPLNPVYEGKRLSTWVGELVPAYSSETQSNARVAVYAIGTNAVPLLLKYLAETDGSNAAIDILKRKWDELRQIPASPGHLFRRSQAVAGFEALGSRGHSAIPELNKLLLHKELAYDAARALGVLRVPETAPVLMNYLNRSEPEMRAAGAAGLGCMGLLARSAVAKLIKLAKEDNNDWVRANAVEALAAIGPSDVIVPILVERLEAIS